MNTINEFGRALSLVLCVLGLSLNGADRPLPGAYESDLDCGTAHASALWNEQMFRKTHEAKYVDRLERILYNCRCDGSFLSQIPSKAYATDDQGSLYWNLFAEGEAEIGDWKVKVETDYPWSGKATMTVCASPSTPSMPAQLRIRIPGWARGKPVPDSYTQTEPARVMEIVVAVNGLPVNGVPGRDGFLAVGRKWKAGDKVELELPMPVKRIRAHESVAACRGRLAVERGPLVYCAEDFAVVGCRVGQAVLPADMAICETSLSVCGATVVGLRAANGLKLIPLRFCDSCKPGDEIQVWFRERNPESAAGCASEELATNSGTSFVADAFAPLVADGRFPGGISVLVDGDRQEVALIGYADARTQRPITLDDHYMQCSQTKGFCGVTAAKLVEEGRLDLDDPVSKYLPEFAGPMYVAEKPDTNGVMVLKPATTPITVRMCLNHTAGFGFELPNYERMGGWNHRMPLRSVAAVAAKMPLRYEPGTRTGYSNLGIDVAAAVVEVVTGMRWEEYLRRTVLAPLGMDETTFNPSDAQLAGAIALTTLEGVGKDEAPRFIECAPAMASPYNGDRVFASAGAGLWTTARDQLKFYRMLMNLGVGDNGVRILKEETVKELLWRSTRPEKLHKSNAGYSLGFSANLKPDADSWFGHGGAWGTECFVNPVKRRLHLWVIQTAENDGRWNRLRREARERFFAGGAGETSSEYTGRMK